MGHGVHGVVGTMDPRANGHVMAGYEILVTWVHFASCPARGMLQELGVGGWAGGRGMGWGQNMSWQVLLYPTHSFPLACLIFSHTPPHPGHRSLRRTRTPFSKRTQSQLLRLQRGRTQK
jgi:hypothetical protein